MTNPWKQPGMDHHQLDDDSGNSSAACMKTHLSDQSHKMEVTNQMIVNDIPRGVGMIFRDK